MRYEWLDDYLLSLPGAEKDYKPEWGWFRYMLRGKLFAAVCSPGAEHKTYGGHDLINLKCDLAIRYGYQRRYPPMLLVTVIFLIVLVQLIQSVFSHVSNRIDKRLDSGHKKGFEPLELLFRFTHTK